jgi:hypothetical protein
MATSDFKRSPGTLTPTQQLKVSEIVALMMLARTEKQAVEGIQRIIGVPLNEATKNWYLQALRAVKEVVTNPDTITAANLALAAEKMKTGSPIRNEIIRRAFGVLQRKEVDGQVGLWFALRHPSAIRAVPPAEVLRIHLQKNGGTHAHPTT